MKLIFKLKFHTRPGQSLWLTGDHPRLGDSDPERAVPLQYLDEESWQATVEFSAPVPDTDITYNYILRNADGSFVYDWGRDKVVRPAAFAADEVLIVDSWNDAGSLENAFYTEPFQQVLLRARHTEVRVDGPPDATHTFKIKAPLLLKGQTLCVVGSAATLGHWQTGAAVLLNRRAGEDFLAAQVNLSREAFPIEYKYGVYDLDAKTLVRHEAGANRVLRDAIAGGHTIINDGFARLPANTWKGAGVAVPVFSLRSERSFGVGEFADLKLLADWCRRTGLKLIQILPVNDTGATHTRQDSYPYSCISAFALHPLYLNLDHVATGGNQRLLAELEPERKRLNALATVDYEAVIRAKLAFIKRIYPSQKNQTFNSEAYQKFFAGNKHWLVPYAAFCHLRDEYGTANFDRWAAHREYHAKAISVLAAESSPLHESIALNYFIQFHLHVQLREATEYARAHGIIVKGDVPIGVARGGADAWQHRELFQLDAQAGAPPDAFAVKGQNWGFPTYNWRRMKADGFAWWKQRFEQMSGYFDAFRIDHILGFFRIWSVPADAVEGILGRFDPAIPVRASEFAARGIRLDRDRFLKPFINDAVLSGLFGDAAAFVKREYLEAGPSGAWHLKPGFTTQRQVEHFFARQEKSGRNEKFRQGLCDLIGNVILFAADNHEFHFRFEVEKTSSFRHLDDHTRAQLRELYVDYFFRRQEDFWRQEALEKLPALKRSTRMLVCGEDLGLVPACVPGVMRQLGLLSLEIQRMPKDPHREFFHPADAPYLSVVTPATHDLSTIRGWWEEDRRRTQMFFNQELGFPGDAPARCDVPVHRAMVLQHLASPAMWSVFQLQDLLGMDERLRRENPDDERINVPSNPRHYWCYRMHLSLETLLDAEAFNDELKRCVREGGR